MLGKYNRRTVRASSGAVAPGATVSFYWQATGTPAIVYADQDGDNPLGSSVLSDADGRIAVFVTPGLYRIVVTLNGETIEELTHEPIVGPLSYGDPNSYALRSDLKLHDEDIQLVTKNVSELKLAGGPRLASGRVLSADEIGFLADTGAMIKTTEYHEGKSIGGDEYQLRTRASYRSEIGNAAWVPDGYGDHYILGGTTYVVVRIRSSSIDVTAYGAHSDGILDSSYAFRAACAELSINPGELYVPNGTYYFATYDTRLLSQDEYSVFQIPGNSSLRGESWGGVVLKIGNPLQSSLPGGARVSIIGIPHYAEHVTVENFVCDQSAISLDKAFHTYAIVYFLGNNIQLRRLKMDRPKGLWSIKGSVNIITANLSGTLPNNVLIEDVEFTNVSKNADPLQTDHAAIYVDGYNMTIRRARIYNDEIAKTWCSGIEVHAKRNVVVEDCYFKHMWPGIYVGSGGTPATFIESAPSYGHRIRNNRFENCSGGVWIFDDQEDLSIKDNSFIDCSTVSEDGNSGYYLFTTYNDFTGVDAGVLKALNISGNAFICTDTTSTNRVLISLGGLQDTIIADNYLEGGGLSVRNTLTESHNVHINSNKFKVTRFNPPFSQANINVGGTAASGGLFTPAPFRDVYITNNTHYADESDDTSLVYTAMDTSELSGPPASINVVARGDQAFGFDNGAAPYGSAIRSDREKSYTSGWSQPSGTQPSIGNGSSRVIYSSTGDEVKCDFAFAAGSTTTFGNNASAWRFALPLINGSRIVRAVCTVASGANMAMCELIVPAGASYFILEYNGQNVRSGYPFANAANMRISAQFSYTRG